MDTLPILKEELTNEYNITRKFLHLYPSDKGTYKPHEKSYSLQALASHLTEILGWPKFILQTEVLDFAKGDYNPKYFSSASELEENAEKFFQSSMQAVDAIKEEDLNGPWSMAHNGHTLAAFNKYSAIRHALNQQTHHRAQLGVYYRLLNITVPNSYGPSADEQKF